MLRSAHPSFRRIALLLTAALLAGCGAAALPVVPTPLPTATPTATPPPPLAATQTAIALLPTETPTPDPARVTPTSGPSPTPLSGPSPTAPSTILQPTIPPGALPVNAPRIEFFTTDVQAVAPGDSVNLYWSTRGASSAVIYRLQGGVRNQLWNVGPDGSLTVQTRRADRGSVDFELSVGDGAQETSLRLSVPLSCPDTWFFAPVPSECPAGPAEETTLVEQPFERGRMIYVQSSGQIYVLFNDGFEPAWAAFENRYNPAVDPESDPNFPNPPNLYQPVRQLGFLWRGRDSIRNRLGLGTQPEAVYTGFAQSAETDGQTTLYFASADGAVVQLLSGGSQWTIIQPE